MNGHGIIEIIAYFVLLLLISPPLGIYMYRVFAGDQVFLSPLLRPLERIFYRCSRINERREMNWKEYSVAMLVFSVIGVLFSYALLRLQEYFPLNPRNFGTREMTPDLAFNTAISFASNTNWQSYVPEATISTFSNMVALSIQNWISAAVGLAVAIAVARGFVRESSDEIGNFWVDVIRATVYVLLPLCLIGALIFVYSGVPQNFSDPIKVKTLEGIEQVIPQGPIASQEVIKQVGTNGGGYFNANSSHPYENPTPFSDLFTKLLIFSIPAALTFTFGRMAGNSRQGWVIFAAMSLMFFIGAIVSNAFEQAGNPQFTRLGVDQSPSNLQSGGNMEGKEVRFGIASSTLFATITTDASCGAVNSMHDSYTPIGGLVTLFNILTGEVIFGGVGAGLYGMLMYVVLAVFIAGLMVGRTPEYLGKKIGRFEVQMSMLSVLVLAASILGFSALATNLELPLNSEWNRVGTSSTYLGSTVGNLNNLGSHGFSEVLYAYASGTGNNGSAFAGISANTPVYNLTLGLAMLIGRFLMIVPLLAMAGSLARKKRVPESLGTFPTDNGTFVILLVGTVLIVGALTFFPALALGPIVEHFQMQNLLLQ